jgi:hypothetical protein
MKLKNDRKSTKPTSVIYMYSNAIQNLNKFKYPLLLNGTNSVLLGIVAVGKVTENLETSSGFFSWHEQIQQ